MKSNNPAPICSCLICHKEYSSKGIFTHHNANHAGEEIRKKQCASIGHGSYTSTTKQQVDALQRRVEYIKSPNLCHYCSLPHDYSQRKNKYCSSSCAATINNAARASSDWERSVESKLKVSELLKLFNVTKPKLCLFPPKPKTCTECSELHIGTGKYCSKQCQHTNLSKLQSARLSDPVYRKKHNYGRGKKSWLESSFEAWLLQHNISTFETENHFFNPILNKNYFVDFLFEDLKLIIELDGTQHRLTIEADAIRDQYLTSIGYNVVRITYDEYQKQSRIDEVKQLLSIA